jgi:hypothetical protein
MKSLNHSLAAFLVIVTLAGWLVGQQQATTPFAATVPQLVNYSGKAVDAKGDVITGIAGITFSIYKDQYEGAPLWMETQNVTADDHGNYSVQLGATKSEGLPLDVFTSGEARWLGVRINGGEEQPRVMLLSVPYALKAGDAATVGGLPPSAFVLAVPAGSTSADASPSPASETVQPALSGSGTTAYVPLWTPNGTTLGNSVLYQTGSGSSAKVGVNTTTPATTLDVKGGETVRGTLSLPATATATATSGKNSQPEKLTASSYNSSTKAAVNENFQWQAEPTGNNTTNPSATLNLLFGSGTNTPSETGLNVASNGKITFATGQTFPGTGTITGITTSSGSGLTGGTTSGTATLSLLTTCAANQVLQWNGSAWACTTISGGGGTVTSVGLSAPSSDFTVSGSPITKSGTLALNWTVSPTNANTANAIVKRDANGNFDSGAIVATSTTVGFSGYGTVTGYDYSGSFAGDGVYGYSLGGSGVVGVGPTGVYGNSISESGYGVYGYGDTGVYGYGETGVYGYGLTGNGVTAYNALGGYGIYSYSTGFTAYLNGPNGDCHVDGSGNLGCTGSTSAVVPVDAGSRQVALYAVEAPENWFEDFGSGRLAKGAAVVYLDATFAQTANTEVDYHVFVTPNGDSRGLYVSAKTGTSFEVHEQGGGSSNISFDYRIVARRKGYENIRLADLTEALNRKHPKLKAPPVMPPPPRIAPSKIVHPAAALSSGRHN